MILAAMLVLMLVAAAPVVAQVACEIGTSNEFGISGDNNSVCLGQQQFGNTGNFTNQQGALQYASDADDIGFSGPGIGFAPESETACEQSVQQSAAASSTF